MKRFGYLIIILAALSCSRTAEEPDANALGTAPAFELENQAGTTTSLQDYVNQPVVLYFCDLTTTTSKIAAQYGNRIYYDYHTNSVQVLYILVDNNDADPIAQEDLSEWGMKYCTNNFPTLNDVDGKVFDAYSSVNALPFTVVIDRSHYMRKKLYDYDSLVDTKVRAAIDAVLE